MIDVSVVIVNWNTRELLSNCLCSLRKQAAGIALEIFVVDNGSTDGSVEMVRAGFPEVEIIENGCNLGFARANNVALRRASGRYLLLLNSDTVVREGALEGLAATMDKDPETGIAGLQLLNEDGSLQNSISSMPSLLTELGNKSLLRLLLPSRYPGKEHRFAAPIAVDTVIGACLMARREAAAAVGLLDEDFFFFLEETDWCLRMKKAGWKVVHDPRYSVYHLQGKSAGKVNVRARIEYWRSRYTFFRKHYGAATRLALRGGLMGKLTVNLVFSFLANVLTLFTRSRLRGKLAVYGGVFAWHLQGCPGNGGLER
jgi:hypothetical protein